MATSSIFEAQAAPSLNDTRVADGQPERWNGYFWVQTPSIAPAPAPTGGLSIVAPTPAPIASPLSTAAPVSNLMTDATGQGLRWNGHLWVQDPNAVAAARASGANVPSSLDLQAAAPAPNASVADISGQNLRWNGSMWVHAPGSSVIDQSTLTGPTTAQPSPAPTTTGGLGSLQTPTPSPVLAAPAPTGGLAALTPTPAPTPSPTPAPTEAPVYATPAPAATPAPTNAPYVYDGEQPLYSELGETGGWNAVTDEFGLPAFQRGNDYVVSDEIFWNPNTPMGEQLKSRVGQVQDAGGRAGLTITPAAVLEGKATAQQLLDEAVNSGVDFVAIDPYMFGDNRFTAAQGIDWTTQAVQALNNKGIEAKIVTQGFVPNNMNADDVRAYNSALANIPGVSEVINFGYEDAPDLQAGPYGALSNPYGNSTTQPIPTATPVTSPLGEVAPVETRVRPNVDSYFTTQETLTPSGVNTAQNLLSDEGWQQYQNVQAGLDTSPPADTATTQPTTAQQTYPSGTLTDYQGKSYDAPTILKLAEQVAQNFQGPMAGGAFSTTGQSIGFDPGQVASLLGGANVQPHQQVALDIARNLMNRGVTDISQLSAQDVKTTANVVPVMDANGNPTGQYQVATFDPATGNMTPGRLLTPDEMTRMQAETSGNAEQGTNTNYTLPDYVSGRQIVGPQGKIDDIRPGDVAYLGETYTGEGGTNYYIGTGPDGKPRFSTEGFVTSDAELAAPLAMAANFLLPGVGSAIAGTLTSAGINATVATAISGGLVSGVTSGVLAEAGGGSFGDGFTKGFIGGAIGSAAGTVIRTALPTDLPPTIANAVVKAGTSALQAAANGGDVGSALVNSLTNSAIGGGLSALGEASGLTASQAQAIAQAATPVIRQLQASGTVDDMTLLNAVGSVAATVLANDPSSGVQGRPVSGMTTGDVARLDRQTTSGDNKSTVVIGGTGDFARTDRSDYTAQGLALDTFMQAKAAGATDAEAFQAASEATGRPITASTRQDGEIVSNDLLPMEMGGEWGDLQGAQDAAQARNTVAIGNDEANTVEEAAALAKSRNPGATQFTFGGNVYTRQATTDQVLGTPTQTATTSGNQSAMAEIANAGTFGAAFSKARELLGPGQTFEWNGQRYTTNYAPAPSPADQAINALNKQNMAGGVNTQPWATNTALPATQTPSPAPSSATTTNGGTSIDAVQNAATAMRDWLGNVGTTLGQVAQNAGDVALGVPKMVGSLAQGAGTLYGLATGNMDNAARTWGANVLDAVNFAHSGDFKAAETQIQKAIQQNPGFLDQFGTTVKQMVLENPVNGAAFLAEQLPILAFGGMAGAATRLMGGGLKAQEAALILSHATIQGGDQASDTYNGVLQRTGDKDIAMEGAAAVATLSGVASALANKLIPGALSADAMAAGIQAGKLSLKNAMRAVTGEVGAEIAEEDAGQVFYNLANDRPWNEGLGEVTAKAMLSSGGLATAMVAANNAMAATGEPVNQQAVDNFILSKGKDFSMGLAGTSEALNSVVRDVTGAINNVIPGSMTWLDTVRNQAAALTLAGALAAPIAGDVSNQLSIPGSAIQTSGQIYTPEQTTQLSNTTDPDAVLQMVAPAVDAALQSGADPVTVIQDAVSGAVQANPGNVSPIIQAALTGAIKAGTDVDKAVSTAIGSSVSAGANITDAVSAAASTALTQGANPATVAQSVLQTIVNNGQQQQQTQQQTGQQTATAQNLQVADQTQTQQQTNQQTQQNSQIQIQTNQQNNTTTATTTNQQTGTTTQLALNTAANTLTLTQTNQQTGQNQQVTINLQTGQQTQTNQATQTQQQTNQQVQTNQQTNQQVATNTGINTNTGLNTGINTNTNTGINTNTQTGIDPVPVTPAPVVPAPVVPAPAPIPNTPIPAPSIPIAPGPVPIPQPQPTPAPSPSGGPSPAPSGGGSPAPGGAASLTPGMWSPAQAPLLPNTQFDFPEPPGLNVPHLKPEDSKFVKEKFINPLQDVMDIQSQMSRDVEMSRLMNQVDPGLAGLLQSRISGDNQGLPKMDLQANPQAMFDQNNQPVASYGEAKQAPSGLSALTGLFGSSDSNAGYSYGQDTSVDSVLGLGGDRGYASGGSVAPLFKAGGLSGMQRENFKEGKHVSGPGDGQSDDIPAWLADGEFVIPADVVSALGNGSNKAGTDKLYDMMHGIRTRARSSGPKDLPPPALESPLAYMSKRKGKAK